MAGANSYSGRTARRATLCFALFSLALAPQAAAQNPGNGGVDAEIVTLTPEGFLRHSIRRPPGRFILILRNRSGIEEPEFVIDRMANNQLDGPVESRARAAKLRRLRKRDIQDLTLGAGTYRLSVAGRPDWVFLIDIKPEHASRRP